MVDWKHAASGVLVWIVVFGAFVMLAGIGDFIANVWTIPTDRLLVIFGALVGGFLAMGSCFYVISRRVGLGLSPIEAIFLNTVTSLVNNLTPFGQATGVPLGAAILTRFSTASYEECLAAMSSKDVISFVPAILVFVLGGSYIAVYGQAIPSTLQPVFGAFALLVLVVVAVAVTILVYPTRAKATIRVTVLTANGVIDRLPVIPHLSEAEVETRLENFSRSVRGVAADPPTLMLAAALSTSAFVLQGCMLWLLLDGVGIHAPLVLTIFIVPVSLMAGGLPIPGGTGGVEGIQILLLLVTLGAARSETITAVVLGRGFVFWFPIIVGSLTLLSFKARYWWWATR